MQEQHIKKEEQEKQVPTELYNSFLKYSDKERWVSYYHQIEEVLLSDYDSILEIGVGNKIFKSIVETQSSILYKSIDIDPDLHPDVLGSVTDIPLEDDSVDAVCAFQILEHLPFEDFEKSLAEIARVSKKGALISLPHFGPPLKLSFKVPFLREFKVAWKIPYFKKHRFNGHHYWEIGKKGYSRKKIAGIISKHFIIEKEYIPFENQYHHFFVLKLKNN